MVLVAPVPPCPNGGYPGPDRKFWFDANDTLRPAVDVAAPSRDDVETFHLAPVLPYPENAEIRRVDVACVGTGMAGITLAALAQWRLKNVNLKIFEKNAKPTGTWLENKVGIWVDWGVSDGLLTRDPLQYPGCRCDLAAHFYVWRWEPNDWTQDYVESDEIETYFSRMSKKYNIDAFTSYSTELVSATWSEPHQAWKLLLRTPSGPVEEFAHFVINGHGVLNRPREAMFGGEEEFTANGGVIMHTARFDRTIPLEGRTVAVIGNGSSGIQTIGTIGRKVGKLLAFQRSKTWITNQLGTLDQLDAHIFSHTEREHYRSRSNAYEFFKRSWTMADGGWPRFILGSPEQEASLAMAKRNLEKLVKDPVLRARLEPSYPVGCRRNTPHEYYFDVLQLPTTTIIQDRIEKFTSRGILTGGVEYPCDIVIKATGFDVSYTPGFEVRGRNGATLREIWKDHPFSYRSVMSSGFPNFFHVMGPNAPVASNSIHMFEEQQIQYAIQAIQHMQVSGIVSLDPLADVEKAWNERIQAGLKGTIWEVDCGGWYKHHSGFLTSHYPGPSTKYMDEIASPIWSEFKLVGLDEMVDPELNKIDAKFGKDVEEVGKMGPPRMPKVPEGIDLEGLGIKLEGLAV